MVLGKLPVPGRPTIWIKLGQGPTALAVGACGGCLDNFTLLYLFSPLSPSLRETARYRLKYCLKGPFNPKQPTNQQQHATVMPQSTYSLCNQIVHQYNKSESLVFVLLLLLLLLLCCCVTTEVNSYRGGYVGKVKSFLFYPITLEARRGTTDKIATFPFHLVLFSAALVPPLLLSASFSFPFHCTF